MTPRPQATSKLLTKIDRTIVTEWRFAPGAKTGRHRHAHDYVVVVLTAGKLMRDTASGEIVTKLAMGSRTHGMSGASATWSIRTLTSSCSSWLNWS